MKKSLLVVSSPLGVLSFHCSSLLISLSAFSDQLTHLSVQPLIREALDCLFLRMPSRVETVIICLKVMLLYSLEEAFSDHMILQLENKTPSLTGCPTSLC